MSKFAIDYSIISRGTELSLKKGYMAISKSINNKRCLFDADHGTKNLEEYKYPLYFDDIYDIYNIALSRFELISELLLYRYRIKDNILIIGLGNIGLSLLINLLDRGYKHINILINNKREYITNGLSLLSNIYNINLNIIDSYANIDNYKTIIDCVGKTIIIKNILDNAALNNKDIILLGTPRDDKYKISLLDIHRRNINIISAHEICGMSQDLREKIFNNLLQKNANKNYLNKLISIYDYEKVNLNTIIECKNNFIEVFKYI